MKCEVDRELFVECLQDVVNTIPSRTTYPVLQNVLLEVKGTRLMMAATDLDTYVRKEIPIQPESVPGKAILLGRKLLEVVRELTVPMLVLTRTDSTIRLDAGRSMFTFAGLDPSEYPEPPAMPEQLLIDFPMPLLEEAFAATAFAAAKDESRPVATGVYWEIDPTEMRMVATDTHRLAFIRKPGEFKTTARLILSPKVYSLLARGEESVKVKADEGKVGLEFASTTIISRLIQGPYLEYQRVIPAQHPNRLKVNRAALTAALRRAAVFASPLARPVTFDLKPDGVQILAETPDLGQAQENLEGVYSGAELKIAFNASFLLDFMSHIDTDDVTLELGDAMQPGLIRPDPPESERLYLLMPIRLD
jgi:DNA polymerase-3 subunit beta